MSRSERSDTGNEDAASALAELAAFARARFDVRDRRYGFPARNYARCFVGSEAVEALIEGGVATDREDAIRLGNQLLAAGVFRHVLGEHPFRDEHLFYRFAEDADDGSTRHGNGETSGT